MAKMTIHLYTLCWNEMDILPFVIDYWKRLPITKAVVYDNGSTDGSVEYLKQFDWIEVRHFETKGMNDEIQRDTKNSCWKESVGKCDFVIICDMDEVLYSNDIISELNFMKENGYNVLATNWYALCGDKKPKYQNGVLLHEIIKTVYKQKINWQYNDIGKFMLFDPNSISEMNYDIGCHEANPKPLLKLYKSDNILAIHFNKGFGVDYFIERRKTMNKRLSDVNKKHGFCYEYGLPEEKIAQEYNSNKSKSFNIMELLKNKVCQKLNVLIVNYNTQKLTEACIKSINKHTPGTKIYVFDNSDNGKFINTFNNVTVFDNTEGQYIDFDDLINSHPEHNESPIGKNNNYVSSKHCASIQKAIDLINDNVVLMDSDVLIKRDISEIYDKDCIYVGGYEHNKWHDKRLMPFLCFINVNMCKQYGIKYFDDKRIVGLTIDGEKYDTGCSFYVDSNKYKHKEINIFDYIIHFAQGSWNRKNNGVEKWLELNKDLWNENINRNVDIFICTHREFEPIVKDEAYKIVNAKDINDDTAPNGLKGSFYSELMTYKYVAENFKLPKYVGFCCYRKYFSFLDDIPNLDEIFSNYDCIVAKPIIRNISIKKEYYGYHNIEDLYIVGGIIADKYPQHANAWHNFINGNVFVPYNMFIMKQEDFKEYIKFIFDILDEYLRIVGTDINKRIYDNYEKYIKDFYPNNTVDYQYRIGGYIGERLTNVFLMSKFKKIKTYPVIVTEDKYKRQ